MRFLVDAQLPVRLAGRLTSLGHDVVHTSELSTATGPRIPRSSKSLIEMIVS